MKLVEEGFLNQVNQNDDGYGLTIMLRKYHDRYLCGHLGSASPYALSLLVDNKSGYGIVTLMNTERNDLRYTTPEMIFDILNNEVKEPQLSVCN